MLALTALGPFAIVLIMRTPRLSAAAKSALSLAIAALFAWIGWTMWRDTQELLRAL